MGTPADQAPREYLRVEWEQVNRLARAGWRLVPIPAQKIISRDMFVMERVAPPACHIDHLMEEAS